MASLLLPLLTLPLVASRLTKPLNRSIAALKLACGSSSQEFLDFFNLNLNLNTTPPTIAHTLRTRYSDRRLHQTAAHIPQQPTGSIHLPAMATSTATTTRDTPASTILNHAAPQPYSFRFSPFLRQAYQVGLPPDRPVCKAFQSGTCPNGTRCPERHVSDGRTAQPTGGLNSLVCKHWLRGLCKKGEHCEFLHEYNLRKMPECNFFMRNGYCSNGEECLYLHVDPMSRLPPCPHYDMGFCPLGPLCSKKHVRRKLCSFYLAGFCPEGPECRQGAHPKWSKDLEKPTLKSDEEKKEEARMETIMAARGDDDGGDRGMRDGHRDRDEGRFGRHGRGGGGGRWRGGRDRRFRGRGH